MASLTPDELRELRLRFFSIDDYKNLLGLLEEDGELVVEEIEPAVDEAVDES